MNEQVVIEQLELLGKQSIRFDDPPKVKLTPHSWLIKINAVMVDNKKVLVDVDGEIKDFESLSLPVKQTIGQRLRLIVSGNYQSIK